MKNKLKFWTKVDNLLLFIIFCVFGFSIYYYAKLPDKIPVHWNALGEIDRYGPKYINLFLLPGISLVTLVIMSYLPKMDPFSQNYLRFARVFQVFKVVITLFFLYLYAMVVYASFNEHSFSANVFFIPAFSLLFIIIGYYLPHLKRNFFIGIRTPWTLSSDESWDRSHFWAGRVFVSAGILNLLGLFFKPEWSFTIFISILVLGIIGITVYSYLVFLKDRGGK